ncbi:MAG: ABC-F family ATP-binding cassette domain-containing protein [FCB group bacterium]|jgi:ATP-binding cassette subfamily F protein 3|nr:ABC-F family ATP-binding cassette domain-containing protein [FCB group bacterium]
MSLIRFEQVSKSFAGNPILERIDLRVEEGEKVGLIGRNGTGKSTVLRLMTGEIEPDGGVIERMRRARLAYLAQMPRLESQDTIFDVVMHSFKDLLEMEHRLHEIEADLANADDATMRQYAQLQDQFQVHGGYEFRARAKQVLTGLGFHPDEFDLRVHALSGGQRTRLMLALVLLKDADLLLLDEPENHLDVEAREWLESFLKSWPRAFVIISHDRRMLAQVVERVVEVERGQLFSYSGNFEYYRVEKEKQREIQQRAYEKQKEFIQREESWIDRFRYKNTKATQVQSRIKRLEKLAKVDAPPPESSNIKFHMGEVVRSGQMVLEAKNLGIVYGALRLYGGVSFLVERGERVGIIGPNGSGKTTLLRQLAGRLPDGTGDVVLGHKVKLGFYDQHHESLNPSTDIMKEILAVKPAWLPEQVRRFMGRFLFTGDDIFKPIAALSGGELSRVAIAKLILSEANVLLLDEPTNHLDIASQEVLESALSEFPGTLVLVSHDRALVDKLVEKLVVVENGQATVHLGNYSRYRWKQGEDAKPAPQERSQEEVLQIRRSKNAARNKDRGPDRRKQRKQLEELEQNIASVEQLLVEFEERFALVNPADYQAVANLKQEYDDLKADLSSMYEEWERLAEEMAE